MNQIVRRRSARGCMSGSSKLRLIFHFNHILISLPILTHSHLPLTTEAIRARMKQRAACTSSIATQPNTSPHTQPINMQQIRARMQQRASNSIQLSEQTFIMSDTSDTLKVPLPKYIPLSIRHSSTQQLSTPSPSVPSTSSSTQPLYLELAKHEGKRLIQQIPSPLNDPTIRDKKQKILLDGFILPRHAAACPGEPRV